MTSGLSLELVKIIIFFLTECRSGGGEGDLPASPRIRNNSPGPVSIPDVNLPILLHLNLVSHRVSNLLPTNISQAYNF